MMPELTRWPLHLDLRHMLGVDEQLGAVPYADIAFEVTGQSSSGSSSGRQALLAHRAVVASRSPVLSNAMHSLPAEDFPGQPGMKICMYRIDPRISKQVWKGILYYMYC